MFVVYRYKEQAEAGGKHAWRGRRKSGPCPCEDWIAYLKINSMHALRGEYVPVIGDDTRVIPSPPPEMTAPKQQNASTTPEIVYAKPFIFRCHVLGWR